MDIYSQMLDQDIADLLFDTEMSIADIAEYIGISQVEVRRRIKSQGLGWVRRSRGGASRGQASLTRILKRLLPGEIIAEYHIGDRLKLDIYCPKYKLAVEYHGRQHFEFVEHFHGDIYGFKDSQGRDEHKLDLCTEHGIVLVVFRYNDELTEDAVFERLVHALQHAPEIVRQEKKSRFKGNPYYESYTQRQREYRKQQYRKMKGGRKTS